MVLSQNLMSIAKFIVDSGKNENENLNCCFHSIPEKMKLPAVYFPNPYVDSANETLSSFALNYSWFIKIIAMTSEDAYNIAFCVLNDIRLKRNKIPVLSEEGSRTGKNIRIDKISIKEVDDNTYQISLSWTERYYYSDINFEREGTVSNVFMDLSINGSLVTVLLDDAGNVLIDETTNKILIE